MKGIKEKMSDEEKKDIENLKGIDIRCFFSANMEVSDFMLDKAEEVNEDIARCLLLIKNQQKELEQEKEKNKELEENLKIAVAMLTKGTYPEKNEGDNDFNKKFIAVDKIKEMKEFYINEHENKDITLIPLENIIKNINVLLEEK